jgi:multidrug efflux pump subunit AcrA (membrane-fusion protein)
MQPAAESQGTPAPVGATIVAWQPCARLGHQMRAWLIGWLIAIVVTLAVVSAVVLLVARPFGSPAPRAASLATAQTGSVSVTLDLSGSFTAQPPVQLSFGTSGVVQHVGVQVGQEVKKGDLLAWLDQTVVAAQSDAAGAALASATARLAADQAGPTVAQIEAAKSDLAKAELAVESA